jgi:glycosyltransferase involved in cell wall biosynthesis
LRVIILKTKKKILVAVTNDISTDERVNKVCKYLTQRGFDVSVYGRKLPETFDIERSYRIIRKKHIFNNNFLFYAEYNLRLLWFLFKNKSDYILSNDLDTLLACYIISKLKKIELVYDSHEYFTEVPELQGRKFVKGFWTQIEKKILPNLEKTYTVSQNIANEYFKRYGIKMEVVKNVPYLNIYIKDEVVSFPTKNKTILYQGVLSEGRGLKQAILSLKYLREVDLVIIGFGKLKNELIQFVKDNQMGKRVHFLGRIPHEKLHNYTKIADIGLVLEEPIGKSFEFSLPNKLFDYIHSSLPIVASPLKEIKELVQKHNIGLVIKNHKPKTIATTIERLLNDEPLRKEIKKNQEQLRIKYCWENESKLLDKFFN